MLPNALTFANVKYDRQPYMKYMYVSTYVNTYIDTNTHHITKTARNLKYYDLCHIKYILTI